MRETITGIQSLLYASGHSLSNLPVSIDIGTFLRVSRSHFLYAAARAALATSFCDCSIML